MIATGGSHMRKRFFCFVLMAVLCLKGLTAYAGNGMYLDEIYGQVITVEGEYISIDGELLSPPYELGQITLDIGMALVYDLISGYPVYASSVYPGMTVRASYNNRHFADTLWLNCGDPRAAAFKATVSENIYYIDEDESVFLTHDGKYRVTISPETLVIDPYVGLINAYDIYPGQQMFIWAEMVTASSPAQVYPEKVVIIY
jgi:hypothetical protein